MLFIFLFLCSVVRYNKAKNVRTGSEADLRSHAAPVGKRAEAYIVTENIQYNDKSHVLAFPVVSHAPLPGKE